MKVVSKLQITVFENWILRILSELSLEVLISLNRLSSKSQGIKIAYMINLKCTEIIPIYTSASFYIVSESYSDIAQP